MFDRSRTRFHDKNLQKSGARFSPRSFESINIDGKKCDHIEDICNNFNNHFSSVAERIINNSSCGTVALNGLWSLASFLIFADHRAYGFHPIKNFRNCAVKILRRFFANFCHEIETVPQLELLMMRSATDEKWLLKLLQISSI
jgi:hypothetical protein